jgi:hypothetical protein
LFRILRRVPEYSRSYVVGRVAVPRRIIRVVIGFFSMRAAVLPAFVFFVIIIVIIIIRRPQNLPQFP